MKLIKSIFFYPMMLIRGLFLTIGNFMGGIFIIGFIVSFIAGHLKLEFLLIGFMFFLITFFYDIILLKINPTDTELTLKR